MLLGMELAIVGLVVLFSARQSSQDSLSPTYLLTHTTPASQALAVPGTSRYTLASALTVTSACILLPPDRHVFHSQDLLQVLAQRSLSQ